MDALNTLLQKVDGKKTYLGATLLFVAGGLLALGLIDQKSFEILATVAGAITAGGLRSALKKIE